MAELPSSWRFLPATMRAKLSIPVISAFKIEKSWPRSSSTIRHCRRQACKVEYPACSSVLPSPKRLKAPPEARLKYRQKILKLYPGSRFVEPKQVTPTVMPTSLTFVEIRTAANATFDYIHLTGYLCFRISGMMLKVAFRLARECLRNREKLS